MLVPLSYNLRSLFVRKSATFLTVLGIGATVAIVSGVLALQQGFTARFTAGGRDDVAIFLRPGATNEGDSQFSRDRGLKLIKSVPEIADGPEGPLASMEAYLAVLLSPERGGVTNVPLRGVQPMTFAIRADELRVVEGRNFVPGHDELIVGKRLVGRIENCRIGDVIVLNKTPFKVVGTFEHAGQFGGEIWGDLDRLLEAMGRYGPNRVIAKLDLEPGTSIGAPDPMAQFTAEEPEKGLARILRERAGLAPEAAEEALERLLVDHDWVPLASMTGEEIAARLELGESGAGAASAVPAYVHEALRKLEPEPGSLAARMLADPEVPAKIYSEQQYLAAQTVMLSFMLVGLAAALGLIMGLAAIFTATNTMFSALAARTHEIGILLAIGFRPFPIFLSFLFEALVLGLLGGLVGIAMALPFNGVEAGTMNWQTFTEMAFSFRVTPTVLTTAIVVSLFLGLLGGAWPAWRAARMRPTVAIRQG
jgi:ABC-type lipoprotein release transport system permease subunit